jgi:hypothetical protein
MANDAPLSSFVDSIVSPRWKQQKDEKLGTLHGSQHFEGKGVCWSSKM